MITCGFFKVPSLKGPERLVHTHEEVANVLLQCFFAKTLSRVELDFDDDPPPRLLLTQMKHCQWSDPGTIISPDPFSWKHPTNQYRVNRDTPKHYSNGLAQWTLNCLNTCSTYLRHALKQVTTPPLEGSNSVCDSQTEKSWLHSCKEFSTNLITWTPL